MAEAPATAAQLRQWAASPYARSDFSPLAERRFLLLDAGGDDDPAVGEWLRDLPCPVIGVGAPALGLGPHCDAVVATAAAAALLIGNIERTPVAAGTLCQLLRTTESLPIPAALTAESLAYATLQAGAEFRRWLAQHRPAPAPTDPGPPLLQTRDGAALALVLNRPSNRNAMSVEVRDALVEALSMVLADSQIERVEISGAGRCFSVGGDLAEFGQAPDPATAHAIRSVALPARLLARCAARVTVRVHGACIGAGVEFPAFAGRVVAAGDAFFQLPELRFGLIPGAGGCVGIARRIGRQRTAWLALSGKRISAQLAHQWELVDALSPENVTSS
jgi:enoyl-CoA hydratase